MLALSKLGYVYIFHLADGDIRGKIKVLPDSHTLMLDPSGLFFAVSTINQQVQMYEVGTGKRVFEFALDFERLGSFAFTQDCCSLVATDATRNNVRFYSLDMSLSNLARRVLLGVQNNPNFWLNYPINLRPDA